MSRAPLSMPNSVGPALWPHHPQADQLSGDRKWGPDRRPAAGRDRAHCEHTSAPYSPPVCPSADPNESPGKNSTLSGPGGRQQRENTGEILKGIEEEGKEGQY